MMIGARFYIGDGMADAPKSLTHDGSDLPAPISAAGFSPSLHSGPWTVTAWIRPIVDAASRAMYAFSFCGVGPYVDAGTSWGVRYRGGSSHWPIIRVSSGAWCYMTVVNDGERITCRPNLSISGAIPIDRITAADRLALLDDDYGRSNGAWHGDITRLCIFSRTLSDSDLQRDMAARGAAPIGAAHWWDFADAESGVATDRIGGVRLMIPPGFVSRSTPWSS